MEGNFEKESTFLLIGRILLSSIFIYSAYGKLTGAAETAAFLDSIGASVPVWQIILAGLVELVGALLLVFGVYVRLGATILAGYLVVVTYMFHLPGTPFADTIQVLKNTSLLGAMFLVMGSGGGKYQVYHA